MKNILLFALFSAFLSSGAAAQIKDFDVYKTQEGDFFIKVLGHGSLVFKFDGDIIYVDPFSEVADYTKLPKAALILITHEHFDHLDFAALKPILTPKTRVIASTAAAQELKKIAPDTQILSNGQSAEYKTIKIEAVPAYNILHKRPDGQYFHPKGLGNGYVLSAGGVKFYIAGDTENIPEMKNLKNIYAAFLPKNLPYTMSDEMFIQAAKIIKPKILYPYHYDTVDKPALQKALGTATIIK